MLTDGRTEKTSYRETRTHLKKTSTRNSYWHEYHHHNENFLPHVAIVNRITFFRVGDAIVIIIIILMIGDAIAIVIALKK